MSDVCAFMLMVVQGKLQPFLAVAAQTLESFVRSLDEEVKTQTEDHNSQEHQFVLALAGTITSELTSFCMATHWCIHTHTQDLYFAPLLYWLFCSMAVTISDFYYTITVSQGCQL